MLGTFHEDRAKGLGNAVESVLPSGKVGVGEVLLRGAFAQQQDSRFPHDMGASSPPQLQCGLPVPSLYTLSLLYPRWR